jgi:hypothetical protein
MSMKTRVLVASRFGRDSWQFAGRHRGLRRHYGFMRTKGSGMPGAPLSFSIAAPQWIRNVLIVEPGCGVSATSASRRACMERMEQPYLERVTVVLRLPQSSGRGGRAVPGAPVVLATGACAMTARRKAPSTRTCWQIAGGVPPGSDTETTLSRGPGVPPKLVRLDGSLAHYDAACTPAACLTAVVRWRRGIATGSGSAVEFERTRPISSNCYGVSSGRTSASPPTVSPSREGERVVVRVTIRRPSSARGSLSLITPQGTRPALDEKLFLLRRETSRTSTIGLRAAFVPRGS